MFAFDYTNVSPDIMTISKGLTGGYMPMAITITTQKSMMLFMQIIMKAKRLCTAILIVAIH